jgi:hypothetical protein
MAERNQRDARQMQSATDDYIRQVAGSSPADEIAKAKALLDAGAISPAEFEHLKSVALGRPAASGAPAAGAHAAPMAPAAATAAPPTGTTPPAAPTA